jgi:hypothetical protein
MLKQDAVISCRKLTKEEFVECIQQAKAFVSIIGHQGTADLVSIIAGTKVETNRVNFALDDDDVLLVVIVKERLSEGVVLSREQVEKIGVDFWEVRKAGAWTPGLV